MEKYLFREGVVKMETKLNIEEFIRKRILELNELLNIVEKDIKDLEKKALARNRKAVCHKTTMLFIPF
jgi:thiamine monophosphate synthase